METSATRRADAMPTYSRIPDSHTAPIVKNDRCAPFVHGDIVIADWRQHGAPGSLVWAKAFGVNPQVVPFEEAGGMKILGQIVGTYRRLAAR